MSPRAKPPCALTPEDIWSHCWHFPPGFSATRHEDEPVPPPYDITCCDCGLEAEVETFNRLPGTHGPNAHGPPMQRLQQRWKPSIVVLPKLRESTP